MDGAGDEGGLAVSVLKFNGQIVAGGTFTTVQANGAVVETIEGLSDSGEIADDIDFPDLIPLM